MNFIKKSWTQINNFLKKRADLIFSVLLVDYAVLIFWEYFAHGMVREVVRPEWLLLGMLLLLLWREILKEQPVVEADLFFREVKFVFPLLIFLFSLVIFLDWWAIDLLAGIIFSSLSVLGLFFLSRYLANQVKL